MATFYDVQAPATYTKVVGGSFKTAGSGAPTAVSGTGFSVARTTTGVYTVTMSQAYRQHLSTVAGTQSTAAVTGDPKVRVRTVGPSATGELTFQLATLSGTTDFDFGDDENFRVNFVSIVRPTGLTK
jgi:hypothetical protein